MVFRQFLNINALNYSFYNNTTCYHDLLQLKFNFAYTQLVELQNKIIFILIFHLLEFSLYYLFFKER